jgi:hypothetical protein
VVAVDVHKGWMEIDTLEDYRAPAPRWSARSVGWS